MRSKKPTNREKKEPASTDQPSGVNGDTSPRIPTQPFYIEIWAVLEMKILRGIKNPAELKQNFLGNLGTVAVIGTLFGGANLSSFMSGFNEGDHEGIGQLVGAVRITAAGWGLVSAVYSAIIMTMMNAVPKVIHFIETFLPLFPLLFLASTILELAQPRSPLTATLSFVSAVLILHPYDLNSCLSTLRTDSPMYHRCVCRLISISGHLQMYICFRCQLFAYWRAWECSAST